MSPARVDNKKSVSNSDNWERIQLQFDALSCCVFANIIQASANSSHVTFQTLGTAMLGYSLLIMNS